MKDKANNDILERLGYDNMRATIHQPYFIPWLGYFSKLAFSDIFVVLDNVSFRKRHYIDRTKIINMHGEMFWLSLPVGENYGNNCNEVTLSNQVHMHKDTLIKTLQQSYSKARHFKQEWPDLERILTLALDTNKSLVHVNIDIIKGIMGLLQINLPQIIYESDLALDVQNATDRIISISNSLNITSLVIGSGMSLEVHDWHAISQCGISIYVNDYLRIHPIYEQSRRKRVGFQAGLSIIDAILNIGRHKTKQLLTTTCEPVHFNINA